MNNPAFSQELRKKAEKKLELQKRKRLESKNRKDELIKKLEKGRDYDIEQAAILSESLASKGILEYLENQREEKTLKLRQERENKLKNASRKVSKTDLFTKQHIAKNL